MAMWDQVSDVTVTEPMKHLRESGKRIDIRDAPLSKNERGSIQHASKHCTYILRIYKEEDKISI